MRRRRRSPSRHSWRRAEAEGRAPPRGNVWVASPGQCTRWSRCRGREGNGSAKVRECESAKVNGSTEYEVRSTEKRPHREIPAGAFPHPARLRLATLSQFWERAERRGHGAVLPLSRLRGRGPREGCRPEGARPNSSTVGARLRWRALFARLRSRSPTPAQPGARPNLPSTSSPRTETAPACGAHAPRRPPARKDAAGRRRRRG